MRSFLRTLRRPLLLTAAAWFAALGGLIATPAAAQSLLDESNPAVFWRLERQREALRNRPVVIQRPTRMTRGVAPRPGFSREVPAGSSAARAAAAASSASADAAAREPATASPGLDGAVRPGAPAPTDPPFVIGILVDNVAQMLALGMNEAFSDRNVSIVRLARENTGLVRDDYYDWPKGVRDLLASDRKIDLAVMMIGSNDRQPIRDGGQSVEILSDRWKEIYSARALAIAQAFQQRGVPLIWVGMTVMKNERLSADLAQFNEIYREAAQKAGATYVDVWEPFVDERNRFTLSGPDVNGHITRIRTGDGVHFTRAGSRKLAHFVEGDVKRYLDRRAAPAPALADAPASSPQNASVDQSAPEGLLGPGGAPIPVPAPEDIAPAPARPVAGPVVPLTASARSPGGELATQPPPRDAVQSLLDGLPPESRAGRADDFRWPRQ
jgi:uncharacterized protein